MQDDRKADDRTAAELRSGTSKVRASLQGKFLHIVGKQDAAFLDDLVSKYGSANKQPGSDFVNLRRQCKRILKTQQSKASSSVTQQARKKARASRHAKARNVEGEMAATVASSAGPSAWKPADAERSSQETGMHPTKTAAGVTASRRFETQCHRKAGGQDHAYGSGAHYWSRGSADGVRAPIEVAAQTGGDEHHPGPILDTRLEDPRREKLAGSEPEYAIELLSPAQSESRVRRRLGVENMRAGEQMAEDEQTP
ncbi:uncharacterized protein LTR77_001975 [Saxophila tyrrhenica]|uniref:Uncharacterized protein n=1 Tax=Saxophila tyrrhenica TaxID=1690608 RepID=A0AAV9PH87_9PEZI|nr:hypothetical protein LTR77_001975 [Saxophila tyrrhenica]